MRAWHVHGSPSREVNTIGEQNGILLGLCCPSRRTNRSAFVCLLPNKHFCSAICWFSPCSDEGGTAARGRRRGGAPPRGGAAAGGRRRGGAAGRRWCERRQRAGLPQSTGTERATFAASPERGARLTVKPPRIRGARVGPTQAEA